MQATIGARCSSFESEQRELSNVRNPCDDLTQRKSSKIVNQGPAIPSRFSRYGEKFLSRFTLNASRKISAHYSCFASGFKISLR